MTQEQTYLLSEQAVVLDLNCARLDNVQQNRLFALHRHLQKQAEYIDIVVGKTSLTLVLKNPAQCTRWQDQLLQLWDELSAEDFHPATHSIPVIYGKEAGPDLAPLAAQLGLSQQDIIELHSSPTYQVKFLGFLPGFAYLGCVPEQLQVARLDSPRTVVPAGSVAIAEDLSAIYPSASPGGWRLLGNTTTQLFTPHSQPPCLLQPGDNVKFVPQKEGLC
ncbi:5-oxoprolinase subunit PxpB [Pseudoalteromonas sp. OOF1S-7]|uniref:5-oxoprolinase subunit PxpB n=1 Tax=Pseudoalteromonas sp. OOF1S-7 TaxID=2917757 RepID=UPI001EF42D2B|nr:5-oxoprolinase subunit PxpB [Pseudoalteromonas sp. OOF1S-7]MCG7535944.1 5-oxoprolinase subunit PxpB [Pseudoalteromonas sp. OOF1S-7]